MFSAVVTVAGILAGCASESEPVDGTKADISAGDAVKTSAQRIFGDVAAEAGLFYYMVGKDAAGRACSLTFHRNENDHVVPNIALFVDVLGQKGKSLELSIGVHADVSEPNASSMKVTANDVVDPTGTDTGDFSFDGASANGLAHLTAFSIESKSTNLGDRSIACSGTHAVLLGLGNSLGSELASKAKAAYKKTGQNIASVTYAWNCSVLSESQFQCVFDVAAKGESRPKLRATFALANGEVGDVLDVTYLR